ncbi:hypothetical protein ABZ348_15535 [Streptomyces sp. NPDC005963]|uniref:hypothetical protein n=1 Tax=Streptomyces sp. NPDC005963 TaxID=3156721 RepID=UPI003402FB6D
MGAGRLLRLTHTAVLAAVCVVVSGLGHDLSSGVPPSVAGYALALPPVCAVAWRLTAKVRGAAFVMGVSAAGQALLHALFGMVSHGGGARSAGHGTGHCSHHAPASTAAHGTGHPTGHAIAPPGGHGSAHGSGPPSSPGAELLDAGYPVGQLPSGPSSMQLDLLTGAFDSATLTSGMALAHLLAGAVCGWWLWRGERALVQLALALSLFGAHGLRFLRTVLLGVRPPSPLPPAPSAGRRPIQLPVSVELLRTLPRRGPPLLPS